MKFNPADVATAEAAEEFVGALGDEGRLAHTAIAGYVSAMAHDHFSRSTRTENPWRSERVKLILRGIANDRAATGRATRESKERAQQQSDPFTADDWRMLATRTPSDNWELMMLSAAALGAALGLRPGELCGGPKEYRTRVISSSQITFHTASHTQILPSSASTPVPHYLRLELRATKTARAGRNDFLSATPDLVPAVWRWACHRAAWKGKRLPDDPFFVTDDLRLLRVGALTGWIQGRLAAHGSIRHITGKCFRRGAASTLAAANAPESDLQAVGKWKTTGMAFRYADGPAMRDRALRATGAL